MRAYLVLGLRVALAILCLSSLLLAQRSDCGMITGLVTDQTVLAFGGPRSRCATRRPVSGPPLLLMMPGRTRPRRWYWAVIR
jgi:hypothetical protein